MNLNKIFSLQNKFSASTVITLIVLLSVSVLSNSLFSDIFKRINYGFQNGLFQEEFAGSKQKTANKSIVVVEIDDRTLQDIDRGGLGRWQEFRRTYFAKVIDNLKQDNAISIGIDVLFSEKGVFYKNDDKVLADSIKKAGNVILAFHKFNKIYPIDVLRHAAASFGDVFTIVNSANQTVYSIYPFYKDDMSKSFSLAVLDKYFETVYGEKAALGTSAGNGSYFDFYNTKIPFAYGDSSTKRNEMLINYLSRPTSFQTLSFVDVYNRRYDPSMVKDKIILIGSTATGLHDEYLSPLKIIPGVFTHANAINTVLNRSFITFFNPVSEIGFLILFVYLITILGIYDTRKYYFISSIFILTIAYLWFYYYAFKANSSIFSYPIQFFISIILSFLFVSIYRYLYEDKRKRLLQGALSQYLAEDLVKGVLSNYSDVKLGGQKMENTIFFSDIAGFTSISEKMEPEELVQFLSIYLKDVSDVIIDNRGFVNKYEGDAVMALWGAFGIESRQTYLSCKAALEQQKAIEKLNIGFKEKYGFEIKVRMGINRGDVIVGNIGSEGRKIEFTALGDNVNLASRLEGINKFYGTSICVSESVKETAGSEFVFRYLDKIKVKGKKVPVDIYELVGYRNEVAQERLDIFRDFEKARKFYIERKFEDAKKMFADLFDRGDMPSVVFMKRSMEYSQNDPGDGWDSSWEFSEK